MRRQAAVAALQWETLLLYLTVCCFFSPVFCGSSVTWFCLLWILLQWDSRGIAGDNTELMIMLEKFQN